MYKEQETIKSLKRDAIVRLFEMSNPVKTIEENEVWKDFKAVYERLEKLLHPSDCKTILNGTLVYMDILLDFIEECPHIKITLK